MSAESRAVGPLNPKSDAKEKECHKGRLQRGNAPLESNVFWEKILLLVNRSYNIFAFA